MPKRSVESWNTGLLHRRNIGCSPPSGLRHHGIGLDLPAARLEIIQHVVRKVQGRAIHDMRVPMTDTDCVAIGSCTCDPPYANATGPTAHIFDNDGLAE